MSVCRSVCLTVGRSEITSLFSYKNHVYKNVEAQICLKFKNIVVILLVAISISLERSTVHLFCFRLSPDLAISLCLCYPISSRCHHRVYIWLYLVSWWHFHFIFRYRVSFRAISAFSRSTKIRVSVTVLGASGQKKVTKKKQSSDDGVFIGCKDSDLTVCLCSWMWRYVTIVCVSAHVCVRACACVFVFKYWSVLKRPTDGRTCLLSGMRPNEPKKYIVITARGLPLRNHLFMKPPLILILQWPWNNPNAVSV